MIKINLKQKISLTITSVFLACFGYFVYANQDLARENFNDTDQDGLSDKEEQAYGTDLANKDTDGDSYSDGTEVESGYDPLKPAPGDRLLVTNTVPEDLVGYRADNLAGKFDEDFALFLNEKQEGDVSLEDLSTFVSTSIGEEVENLEKKSILTEEELASIKVKKQDYINLSSDEVKEKEEQDAVQYINSVFEVLIRNAPMEIRSENNLQTNYQVFLTELDKLGSDKSDYSYFRKIGERLVIIEEQMKLIEVPEKLLDSHIKLLEIIKGFVVLKEFSLPMEDSTGKLIIISRSMALGELIADLSADLFGGASVTE